MIHMEVALGRFKLKLALPILPLTHIYPGIQFTTFQEYFPSSFLKRSLV